jgi:hypothetical protein
MNDLLKWVITADRAPWIGLIISLGGTWAPNVATAIDPTSQVIVPEITKPHPRLYVDGADIALMKQRVDARSEPWYGAWVRVKDAADKRRSGAVEPRPLEGPVTQETFFLDALTDARACVYLALAWHITGDEAYAEVGLETLLAWARAEPNPCTGFDPSVRFPNMGMEVARATSQFVWAYDLLCPYPGFAPADKKVVQAWMRVLEKEIKTGIARWAGRFRWVKDEERWVEDAEVPRYFGGQEFQNHIAGHTMGLVLLGYALGDRELAQYAIDSTYPRNFKALISGCILMDGDPPFHGEPDDAPPPHDGEIYDRYRHYEPPGKGIGYAHLTLSMLVAAAEVAYHNGLDFYTFTAPGGETLEKPFDFYADLYRLKDSTLKGGFYSGEDQWFTNTWLASLCEIALKRYPKNRALRAYLRTVDRAQAHHAEFLGIPVLTHGVVIEPEALPRAARDRANFVTQPLGAGP